MKEFLVALIALEVWRFGGLGRNIYYFAFLDLLNNNGDDIPDIYQMNK